MTRRKKWVTGLLACAALLVLLALGAAGYRHWKEEQTLKAVQSMYELYNMKYPSFRFTCMADYAQFDYQGLWKRAHTIALVTPEDELTQENSRGISETGDRFYNAHSVRTVRALQFYKNEREYEETFQMVEECAMLADGSVVGMDESYPMQKGDVYLVFLCESGWGYPIIVSADNGKFDLTNLRLNNARRQPLIAGALMDLGLMPMARSRSEALEYFPLAKYVIDNGSSYYEEEYNALYNAHRWQTMEIRADDTLPAMTLTVEYAQTEDGYLYHVGNRILSATVE